MKSDCCGADTVRTTYGAYDCYEAYECSKCKKVCSEQPTPAKEGQALHELLAIKFDEAEKRLAREGWELAHSDGTGCLGPTKEEQSEEPPARWSTDLEPCPFCGSRMIHGPELNYFECMGEQCVMAFTLLWQTKPENYAKEWNDICKKKSDYIRELEARVTQIAAEEAQTRKEMTAAFTRLEATFVDVLKERDALKVQLEARKWRDEHE